jgi:hypothetical protein
MSINNVSGLDQFQGTIERFWEIMRRIRGPTGAVFFRLGFPPNSLTIPVEHGGIDELFCANRKQGRSV